MPLYFALYEQKQNTTFNREALSIRASNLDQAKERFDAEAPVDHKLVAITEDTGGSQRVLEGQIHDTMMLSLFMRNKRALEPVDRKLGQLEQARDELKTERGPEPSLKDLEKRNPNPSFTSFFTVFGWLLVAVGILATLVVFDQMSLNVLTTSIVVPMILGTIISGLLFVAIAWAARTLNKIMIASTFQARLAEYQHITQKISNLDARNETQSQ